MLGRRAPSNTSVRKSTPIGSTERYERFLAYGDLADYHAKLEESRIALQNEAAK